MELLPPITFSLAWKDPEGRGCNAYWVDMGDVNVGMVERMPVSNKWEAVVNASFAPCGARRHQRSLGTFDTRAEAGAELRIQYGWDAVKELNRRKEMGCVTGGHPH